MVNQHWRVYRYESENEADFCIACDSSNGMNKLAGGPFQVAMIIRSKLYL